MKTGIASVLSLLLFFSFTSLALAGTNARVNKSFLGGVAIEGYDPVAYFTEGKAIKGDSSLTQEYHGATWQFASKENRALFAKDPEKYAPQYGGFCAYGVAKGSTVGIDPESFTIHDGKLYLNYNRSIHKQWLANKEQFITNADANWPNLK